jgi:hypothetical protein
MISLRAANEEDKWFLHSSMFSNLRSIFRKMNVEPANSIYTPSADKHFAALLKRADTCVAYSELEPKMVIGYSVFEGPTLHWIFLKGTFRRQGIGTKLLPSGVHQYTHMPTPIAKQWFNRLGLRYNPFFFEE